MNSKKSLFLAFVPGLLLMACMDTTALDQQQADASDAISAKGQAMTNLYLSDMADSTTAKPATSTSGKATEKDKSVLDDTKAARLTAMAQKMLDRLDADDSGSLSEAEFLAIAKPLDAEKAAKQSAEQLAAKEAKLKEQFVKFAGADSLLSAAEIEAGLKAQGDRIGKFRTENHKGQHEARVKEVTAEVLEKFDANKDGKLDETEIAALRAADKEACKGKGKGGDAGDTTKTSTGSTAVPADPKPAAQ